jgi:hypothetical protein
MENRIALLGILVAVVMMTVAVRASPVLAYEGPINPVIWGCAFHVFGEICAGQGNGPFDNNHDGGGGYEGGGDDGGGGDDDN